MLLPTCRLRLIITCPLARAMSTRTSATRASSGKSLWHTVCPARFVQESRHRASTRTWDPTRNHKCHDGVDQKAKKGRRIQTERVEGVARTNYWPRGETAIPSDEKWKLMGPEWLDKFKKTKINDRLHSSAQTKKKILMSTEST